MHTLQTVSDVINYLKQYDKNMKVKLIDGKTAIDIRTVDINNIFNKDKGEHENVVVID